MSGAAPLVLVTGASGFIGSRLVAALNNQGVRPRVLLRDTSPRAALDGLDVEAVLGDVGVDDPALSRACDGVETVYHVAAVSDYWRQPVDRLYAVNVDGTRRMLDAALAGGVRRFVFTSSLASLGLPRHGELLTEAHEFNLPAASFPYGHSKHMAESLVREAADAGLEAVIVNPAVVLGPGDINQISGSIVVEAARGLARFRPPGGANYIHVADVVAGHLAAAERGRPGQRYILGNANVAHAEALDTVCQVLGRDPPTLPLPAWLLPPLATAVSAARRVFGNRVPLDANQVRLLGVPIYADVSRARQELGLPQTPFLDAVRDTVAWYRQTGVI